MKLFKRIFELMVVVSAFFVMSFHTCSLEGENVYWSIDYALVNYVLNTDINVEEISRIEFNNTIMTNKIITSDISYDVTKEGTDGKVNILYKDNTLYIQYAGTLVLNENSSNLFYWFKNVKEISGLEFVDTSKVTDMSGMFYDMNNLETLDLSSFDTSNVTDMSVMFTNVAKVKNLNLTNFNTSKVTDMSGMFDGMLNLEYLDLSSFDTSKVNDMSGMFPVPSQLKVLNISNFIIDDSDEFRMPKSEKIIARNMEFPEDSSWFFHSSIKEIDLKGADTSKTINMSNMFYNASEIEELDLSSFNTSNVTDMSGMFSGMINVEALDLSSFDTSNVTSMKEMFFRVENVETLDLSGFNTSKVTDMQYMFEGMKNLKVLDVSSFNTSNVIDMSGMFWNLNNLESLNIDNFDTSKVKDMSAMFIGLENLETLDLSSFDTSNVTDFSLMFVDSNFGYLNFGNFDMRKATENMATFRIFDGTTAEKVRWSPNIVHFTDDFLRIGELDISNMTLNESTILSESAVKINAKNTVFVGNCSYMFSNMKSLEEIDLTNVDTSQVTSMRGMFSDTDNLTTLDLSSFDTSNVTNMSSMFSGMTSLKKLDLRNFDTSNVTDMQYMFSRMTNLKELDVTSFDTSKVTNMDRMFNEANSLEVLDLTSFDNGALIEQNHFINGSLEKLFCEGLFQNMESLKTIYASEKWKYKSCSWENTQNLVGGRGLKVRIAKIDEVYSPGSFTYKYDFEINDYIHTNSYIYLKNDKLDLSKISHSNNIELKIENNQLKGYAGKLYLLRYDLISINSEVFDLNKGYIYYNGDDVCSKIDVINANCKSEDNKVIIYKNNDILEEYDLIRLISPYDINDKVIYINEEDFSIDKFSVTNAILKYENASLKIYRNNELIDNFKIYSGVKEIQLEAEITDLKINQKVNTKVIVNSSSEIPSLDYSIIYTSSNPKIATVDANGVVTAISKGNVIITATTNNGKNSSIEFNIDDYAAFTSSSVNNLFVKQKELNKIVLSWDNLNESTEYIIYRSKYSNKKFSEIGRTNDTIYIDENALEHVKYYYKVRAINSDFSQNKYSKYSSVESCITSITKPNINVSSHNYNSIKITYDKVTGADGYIIYRSTSKSSGYKQIKITSSTSYTDKNLTTGKTYYYKVKAYSYSDTKAKYYSSTSSYKLAKPTVAKPKYSVSSYDYNVNKIVITKPSGAHGYAIYRSDSKDGNFKLLAVTTKTTYYDKKLTTGKAYYYKVKAYRTVNRSKKYGFYSNVLESVPTLKTPTFTVENSSRDSLKLKINPVNGATGYYIYEIVNGEEILLNKITGKTYTHQNLILGDVHTYKVKAYKDVKGKISFSDGKTISKTVVPLKIKLNIKSDIFYRQIVPSVINDLHDTDNVKVYLYRTTSKNGTYNLVNEYECLGHEYECIFSYEFDNLILNKTYYYKAQIEINGVKSPMSDVIYKKATTKPSIKFNRYKSKSNYLVLSTIEDDEIDGYQIYRASYKNGKYTKIYEGSSNYKILKGTYNRGYYYKIRYYKIYDGKKVYSEFSSIKYARFGDKRLKNF